MTPISIGGAVVLALCGLVAVLAKAACLPVDANRPQPPSADDANRWEWVAAGPGVNVYISRSTYSQDAGWVSVWVDRRFSGSLASVARSVLEMRQFDCQRRISRQNFSADRYRSAAGLELTTVSQQRTNWTAARPGTVAERVLAAACRQLRPRDDTAPVS